jgi:hypothetical protein
MIITNIQNIEKIHNVKKILKQIMKKFDLDKDDAKTLLLYLNDISVIYHF